MSTYDLIASMINSNVERSTEALLYEYVSANRILRINDFANYCRSNGVNIVAEEIMLLMKHDQTYIFEENQDKTGRFWSVSYYNNRQQQKHADVPVAASNIMEADDGISDKIVDAIANDLTQRDDQVSRRMSSQS